MSPTPPSSAPDRGPVVFSQHEAWQWGWRIGQSYPNLWANDARISSEITPVVSGMVQNALKGKNPVRVRYEWLIPAWTLVALSVFIAVVAAANGRFVSWIIGILLLNGTATWMWLRGYLMRSQELAGWTRVLTATASSAAWEAIYDSRRRARLGNRPEVAKPAAQPYGVSDRGAEELCTQWMKHLGDLDAETTQYVNDGGIDIASPRYIAQVKNYAKSVPVAAVREFAGVASVDGRTPMFFTSGNYPSGALDFAERSSMALFVYDAVAGTLTAANKFATEAIRDGI